MHRILTNRKIIDILIGDKEIEVENQKVCLPYLSGTHLVSLSNELGYPVNYGKHSRWTYMDDLIRYLIDIDEITRLFKRIFSLAHFESDISAGTLEEIDEKYKNIIKSTINEINSVLFFSGNELKEINLEYYVLPLNHQNTINIEFKTIINQEYILGLEGRVREDLNNQNYDSVLTKCRTILEEVLIYILEEHDLDEDAKGDIVRLYNSVKKKLKIQQKKEFDKRVNQLLSGIENVINSIASMRNITSDAHGKGKNRIKVSKREAELTINSTKTICLYLISVSDDQKHIANKSFKKENNNV